MRAHDHHHSSSNLHFFSRHSSDNHSLEDHPDSRHENHENHESHDHDETEEHPSHHSEHESCHQHSDNTRFEHHIS